MEDYDKATKLFNSIIDHYEPLQAPDNEYKPIPLLRNTKEGVSVKDDCLALFFTFIEANRLGALAAKPTQPTPTSLSRAQLSQSAIGTPQKFDIQKAEERYKKDAINVEDDGGDSLLPERNDMAYLEVAHIIAHFLVSLSNIGGAKTTSQTEPKQISHKILKMFNPRTVRLISGTDIDRLMNALTLTHDLHRLFGNFEIAFEPIDSQPQTYKIKYVNAGRIFRGHWLPVTRTLYVTPGRSIEPPSIQLSELHHAIGQILHSSAAGKYIDKLIRDTEDIEGGRMCSNGSTRIDDYIRYRLTGQGLFYGRSR
ncbi:HNH endonuclease signature motif containing protein [Aspergillus alliaceus]|uniref:HNH endonuclease signature motif containing protein n=1 Tax=Petromyces alliaceus TaxID=209559 RepID=UPI0012A662CD|nr:uncharacterized protein BDW43DRAFT_300668 [Aspergillus alliaceus]KAB8232906.1 hypothetical protein BDW43DRAFT_300668 [Aspergillus alliaceus]